MAKHFLKLQAYRERGLIHIILIVEDEYLLQDLLREVVRAWYDHVYVAASAAEALHIVRMLVRRRQRPHSKPLRFAALIDVRLPGGMDGIHLAKHLRSEFDIPALLMTGHDEEAPRMEESGFLYLRKPLKMGEVHAALDQLLRH